MDFFHKTLDEHSKFIAECEAQIRTNQIKSFGKVLPKIAGECEWGNNGCPIRLVKPYYPQIAKRYGFFGTVDVEIIIDERGKVVYSKAIKGSKLFYSITEKAALVSLFYPKLFCGKAVLQRRIIRYNFIFL